MSTIKKNDEFIIPMGMTAKSLAKILANNLGVEVCDFTEKGNKLIYIPKKKAIIKKPNNMGMAEYIEKLVLPNNKEFSIASGKYENEVWRPVQNIGRYFDGQVDYSDYYEVSNLGRLRAINIQDAMKSSISEGYDAPTRNAMQFHLNAKGIDGKKMNTCPDVKYMVADAFLEHKDESKFMIVHIDGDYHNNCVDNLSWVER